MWELGQDVRSSVRPFVCACVRPSGTRWPLRRFGGAIERPILIGRKQGVCLLFVSSLVLMFICSGNSFSGDLDSCFSLCECVSAGRGGIGLKGLKRH